MLAAGETTPTHCAYTLDPSEYEFTFEEGYEKLLERADGEAVVSRNDGTMVWRCRRKTNPNATYCPFHHHLENSTENEKSDQAIDDAALTRAFLEVIRDEFDEPRSWVNEELNEREEGCVLEIVPRPKDPPDGTKRRRKQFLGARFGDLSLTYEHFESPDRYPIDLRGAAANEINWSNAIVPFSVFATDLVTPVFTLDRASVAGDVRVGRQTGENDQFDGLGMNVSIDDAEIDGTVRIDRAVSGDWSGTTEAEVESSSADVSLDGAEVSENIEFDGAEVSGNIEFDGAEVGGDVSLISTRVGKFVSFDGAEVGGDVRLDGAEVGTGVHLTDAVVGKGVLLFGPEVGGSVRLSRTEVGEQVWFNRGEVRGSVRLNRAEVRGRILLDRTEVGWAISLENATVDGDCEFEHSISSGIKAAGLSTDSQLNLRSATVAGDIALIKAEIGAGYREETAEVELSDALIVGSVDLKGATVHGQVNFAGTGDADGEAPPSIHARVDLCHFTGSVCFQEACLSHPGIHAVPARSATLAEVELFRERSEETKTVLPSVVYDFEEATLGTLVYHGPDARTSTDEETRPSFLQLRFLETTFDGFQFNKHRPRFAASEWNLEGLRERGLKDIDAVDKDQFKNSTEAAKSWLEANVADDGVTACERLNVFVIVDDDQCRELAGNVEILSSDIEEFLTELSEYLDIASIRVESKWDSFDNELAMLQYVLSEEGPDHPLAFDIFAQSCVERLDGEEVARKVIDVLTSWHAAERRNDKQAGRGEDSELPAHTVSRSVTTAVADDIQADDALKEALADIWIPIGQLWVFLHPEQLPEDIDVSPPADILEWYATEIQSDDPKRYPPAEWTHRLLDQVTAAIMHFEAESESPALDELEATYSMAKTAAVDAGANSAASQFFFREKDYAREQHWQQCKKAIQKFKYDVARGQRVDIAAFKEAIQREEPVNEDSSFDDAVRYAIAWFENSVLRYLTGYGERPSWVIFWAVGVVGIFFLIYVAGFSFLEGADTLAEAGSVVAGNLLPAIVLSLGSFATLLPTTPLLTGSGSPCGTGATSAWTSDVGCQFLQLLMEVEGFLGVFLVAVFVFTLTRSVQR